MQARYKLQKKQFKANLKKKKYVLKKICNVGNYILNRQQILIFNTLHFNSNKRLFKILLKKKTKVKLFTQEAAYLPTLRKSGVRMGKGKSPFASKQFYKLAANNLLLYSTNNFYYSKFLLKNGKFQQLVKENKKRKNINLIAKSRLNQQNCFIIKIRNEEYFI